MSELEVTKLKPVKELWKHSNYDEPHDYYVWWSTEPETSDNGWWDKVGEITNAEIAVLEKFEMLACDCTSTALLKESIDQLQELIHKEKSPTWIKSHRERLIKKRHRLKRYERMELDV